MPIGGGFGVSRSLGREALPQPEILKFPLETTRIESWVVDATGVAVDSSGGPYDGRYYLLAGTVLSKRADGQLERFTGVVGQVVYGILFDTVEFADNSNASDQPVPVLNQNVNYDKNKIVDFVTHQAAIEAALDRSEFL